MDGADDRVGTSPSTGITGWHESTGRSGLSCTYGFNAADNRSHHAQAGPPEAPGGFRRHDIAPFPGGMQPPPFTEIGSALTGWLSQAHALSSTRSDDIPEVLAILHAHFERIPPFLDGNGRTGRLVTNLLLVRLGYPPAIIYKRDRAKYLRALRRADAGDPGSLGELLARAILDNLHRFVLPAIAGPARLVPLQALADDELSLAALRVAASRGRLRAHRGPDGSWRSSQHWVDAYKLDRRRRRL